MRLTRHFSDDGKVWVFGQATLGTSGERERNDRIGIGAEKALGEKLSANAEISYGTSGVGVLAGPRLPADRLETAITSAIA